MKTQNTSTAIEQDLVTLYTDCHNNRKEDVGFEYTDLLNTYGLNTSIDGIYIYSLVNENNQGWVIDISAIKIEVVNILNTVIPVVIANQLSFRVIKDETSLAMLNEGCYGYSEVGKVISILIEDGADAVKFAKQLIQITSTFHGPAIPSAQLLSGIVYARYGSLRPRYFINENGERAMFIFNNSGIQVAENNTIPYQHPLEVNWPFNEVMNQTIKKHSDLLNYTYKLSKVLKSDAKGMVYKGYYFNKFLLIKTCIVKEGKRNMLSDDLGRDITDRLKWQKEIYQELKNKIPIPEIFDLFEENGSTYLVMKYIKGKSFQQLVREASNGKVWYSIDVRERHKILTYLFEILNIIEEMHASGFVHRDITPANFLISNKGEIYLIDLELSYNKKQNKPQSPFLLGTNGYMSPQQKSKDQVDYSDDIYAIGALLIFTFTNIQPVKFELSSSSAIRLAFSLLINNSKIVDLISSCLEGDKTKRASLFDIKLQVKEYIGSIRESGRDAIPECTQSKGYLQAHLKNCVNGLRQPNFIDTNGIWTSPQKNSGNIGNELASRLVSKGFHNGISGIVYVIGKIIGICKDVEHNIESYRPSISYLLNPQSDVERDRNGGLYEGTAGIALAVNEGLKSKIIPHDVDMEGQMMEWLSVPVNGFTISNGICGQGLAVLHCRDNLPKQWAQEKLKNISSMILDGQNAEGIWTLSNSATNKKHPKLGFSSGVSGVIMYLLSTYEIEYDEKKRQAIELALEGLKVYLNKSIKEILKRKSTYQNIYDVMGFGSGIMGAILPFIKSYKLFGDVRNKNYVENILSLVPTRLTYGDYSLGNGLAGIGHTFLDAAIAFNEPNWGQRATWISELFLRTTRKSKSGYRSWRVQIESVPTASLYDGNAGLIHFQLRMLYPEQTKNILEP